ncbi:hypothetical protein FB451DRAFT_1095669, partial [Mycena latifolia]
MAAADLRLRLAQLDAQIAEQKLALDVLQRTRLDVEHELHATATFPVSKLPVELTAEIFLWCLPAHEDAFEVLPDVVWEQMSRLSPHAPLALASVCRRWREVVLSTPTLWSRLEYRFSEDEIEAPETGEAIMQWLGRAESQPLSIILRWHPTISELYIPTPVHNLIHRHSDAIQHLGLEMPRRTIQQLGLDSRRFPLLRSARLFESLGNNDAPVHVFTDAPLLHILHSSNSHPTLPAYILPWLQLTTFHGQINSMDLFAVAPNLTEVICSV